MRSLGISPNVLPRLLLLLLALFVATTSSYAQETEASDPEDEAVDAVLLIDASGSMRITDSKRLRVEGTRLFFEFLNEGDRISLIEFAEKPKVLRPLIEYNKAQQIEVNRIVDNLSDSGEYTDMLAALRQAQKLLNEPLEGKPSSAKERVIVFLSDGNLDSTEQTGSAEEQQKELFEKLVPALKNDGIKVYTLSFSEQANTEMLEALATATDAEHWFTPTADKVHESFADLFVVVKKPQIVPLTSKGFRIDKEIQEATFYINRQDGEEIALISPSNEKFTLNTKKQGFRWFPGQQFDVITIEEPEDGQWQISGIPKNEGFATVLTNLKLDTAWPAVVRAGEVTILEARLYESIKPVVLPEMTDVIKYAFEITPTDKVSEPVLRALLSDDGENGDRIARDGIFSGKVTLEDSGEYKLRVLASGPTFERHQQLSFRVKPRLVGLRIIPTEQAISVKNSFDPKLSLTKDYFQLELSPELSGAKRTQVDLFATDKRRRRYKVPINRVSDSIYEASSLKLPHEGEYTLYATVSAEGRRNKKFRGRSQERTYVKEQVIDAKGNVVSVVLVDEDKPKEAPEGFPWVFLVLLIAANGGLGYTCINKLKALQASMSDEAEEVFAELAPFEAALADLRERSQASEIDFEAPMFTDESIALAPDLDISLSDPDAPVEEAPPPPAEGEAGGEDESGEAEEEGAEAAPEEGAEEAEEAAEGEESEEEKEE